MAKKCRFWCKLFGVVKVVVAIASPPVGLMMEGADRIFHISDALEEKVNEFDENGVLIRERSNLILPSQQVRSGRLNLM